MTPGRGSDNQEDYLLNLPKIDLSSLLDTVTGLFGTLPASEGPSVDDCVVVIITYISEVARTEALL